MLYIFNYLYTHIFKHLYWQLAHIVSCVSVFVHLEPSHCMSLSLVPHLTFTLRISRNNCWLVRPMLWARPLATCPRRRSSRANSVIWSFDCKDASRRSPVRTDTTHGPSGGPRSPGFQWLSFTGDCGRCLVIWKSFHMDNGLLYQKH